MKKVRYLTGIAALVPATAAAAAVTPAAAATAATAAKPMHLYERVRTVGRDGKVTSSKKVALHAIDGGMAYAPTVAAACTGITDFGPANHNHESIQFWYTASGCVGTVKTVTYAAIAGVCAQPVVKYYAAGTLAQVSSVISSHGGPFYFCSNKTWYFGPHRYFLNPVGVYAHANIAGGGELGPVGTTVN